LGAGSLGAGSLGAGSLGAGSLGAGHSLPAPAKLVERCRVQQPPLSPSPRTPPRVAAPLRGVGGSTPAPPSPPRLPNQLPPPPWLSAAPPSRDKLSRFDFWNLATGAYLEIGLWKLHSPTESTPQNFNSQAPNKSQEPNPTRRSCPSTSFEMAHPRTHLPAHHLHRPPATPPPRSRTEAQRSTPPPPHRTTRPRRPLPKHRPVLRQIGHGARFIPPQLLRQTQGLRSGNSSYQLGQHLPTTPPSAKTPTRPKRLEPPPPIHPTPDPCGWPSGAAPIWTSERRSRHTPTPPAIHRHGPHCR